MDNLKKSAEKLDGIVLSIQRKIRARLHNELSQGIITIPQFHVLTYLLDQGEAIMVELARFLQVSASAITSIVDNLVKMGMVKRHFSLEDRRIVLVSLTRKGKDIITRIRREFRELLENILEKFTPKEREKFLELSEKMERLL